jgi:hypothetical protein
VAAHWRVATAEVFELYPTRDLGTASRRSEWATRGLGDRESRRTAVPVSGLRRAPCPISQRAHQNASADTTGAIHACITLPSSERGPS